MSCNYETFGEEWKIEMNRHTKAGIIEIAAQIGRKNEALEDFNDSRIKCRDYLLIWSMAPGADQKSIAKALEILGFQPNGLPIQD